jgi:hypothetical protein
MKNDTEMTKDKYQKLLVEHSLLQTKMAQLENDTGRKSYPKDRSNVCL